jgi:hypothetical protein
MPTFNDPNDRVAYFAACFPDRELWSQLLTLFGVLEPCIV